MESEIRMSNSQVVTTELVINGQKFKVSVEVGKFKLEPIIEAPPIPDPDKPQEPAAPKDFGTIKQGGKWSTNPGKAETWILKNMDNPSDQFKFISTNDQKNIIANIKTKDDAIAIQNYFKTHVFPPKENGGEVTDPEQPPITPTPTTGAAAPVKVKATLAPISQRGPTRRNYRSGKPSDNTIEKNAKGLGYKNVCAVFVIGVPPADGWEHDDTLNIKIGGSHMGTGWFSHTITIYEGQTWLGKEENHPNTDSHVVEGKKYGDIRGKEVGIAATYFSDTNQTAFYVKMPGADGWDKAAEATNVGGFNPEAKPDEQEVQLRIDGFKNKDQPPDIKTAMVSEIEV